MALAAATRALSLSPFFATSTSTCRAVAVCFWASSDSVALACFVALERAPDGLPAPGRGPPRDLPAMFDFRLISGSEFKSVRPPFLIGREAAGFRSQHAVCRPAPLCCLAYRYRYADIGLLPSWTAK